MEYTKGKVMEESKPVAFMVHIPESRRGVKMDYVFYYKEDSVMLKSHRDYGDEITPLYAALELTPAVVACLKRGLNCWPQQNFSDGAEIRKILEKAEEVKLRIGEDV